MTITHDSPLTTDVAAPAPAPWFAIATMRWARLPCEIAGPGYQCAAIVLRDPASKVHHWHRVDARGRIAERIARHGAADRRAPDRWRPLAGHAWPHPLPSPIADWQPARTPGQRSPEAEAEPGDPTQQGDGWPYPGLRLGERVPPTSIEECEARLLRAFRTSASRETGPGVGLAHRTTCADIPAEYVKIALKYEHALAQAEAWRRGETLDAEKPALRSAWSPLRRDREDWLYALGWVRGIAPLPRRVLAMRADDPVWSFRQIAEELRRARYGRWSAMGLKTLYDAAIATAFACAAVAAPS